MKKVVIVTGSPRANGNTNAMAAKFAEVAKTAGAEVTRFDACALKLDGCHACGMCYKTGHACAVVPEYDAVIEAILAADTVVFAIPLYWFTIPSQLKAVIDHFYAAMRGGKSMKGKRCIVLGTMGQPVATGLYAGVTTAMKGACGYLGWTYEELVYGGMNIPGAIKETDAFAKIEAMVK